MLISELLSQVGCEGGAVGLPMYLWVHTVEADQFCEYKNQLSGLKTENILEARDHITALGLCLMQQRPQQDRWVQRQVGALERCSSRLHSRWWWPKLALLPATHLLSHRWQGGIQV